MKKYLVYSSDLPLMPLVGQNPKGGNLEDFDDLSIARDYAESEKDHWDLVTLYEKKGEWARLEYFVKGRKYSESAT
jgi:hypothetical protein